MTITFAGVPMLLESPNGAVTDFIQRYWSLPTNPINSPPRRIDTRTLCQPPAWPQTPNLKINQLYQPSGATRWSRCLLLCDDVSMNRISGLQMGTLTFGAGYPCTPVNYDGSTPSSSSSCTLDQGDFNIGGNFSAVMYKLDPIPVSIKGASGLYIVPLVDERYFWQGINLVTNATAWYQKTGSSSSSSSSNGTGSLFGDIIDALASNATGLPASSSYISGDINPIANPSCLAFRNGAIPAAAALDLLCWSLGLLLVPNDYHNYLYNRITGEYYQTYRIIGPGNKTGPTTVQIWSANKRGCAGSVSLQSVAGNDKYGAAAADNPLTIEMLFNNQCNTTQPSYTSAVGSAVPGSSSSSSILVSPVNPIMSVHGLATADAAGSSSSSSSSGLSFIPGNKSDLDSIASLWGNRWYASNLFDFDWSFNGMPILKFCGREDYILLDQSLRKRGAYGAFTRWVSLPSHYGYEYVAIETAAHCADCCIASNSSSSSGGGGGGSDCGCCDGFSCITPSQATVGGCSAAPDGAAYQYTINIGNWAAYSVFTPSGLITLTYGSPIGCGSSSSSSSSSSSGGSGCVWYSCIYPVTEPSSSSSSSSSVTGTYQWQAKIYTDGDGNPALKCVPVLLSGTDWLGIAEVL